MRSLFLVIALSFQPLVMAAGWTTGNELNEDLNSGANDFHNQGFAMGFISAIADREATSVYDTVANIAEDTSLTPEKKRESLTSVFNLFRENYVCFPQQVTRGQLIAIVKKWLTLHPERWNENASILVENALRESFPCRTLKDFLQ